MRSSSLILINCWTQLCESKSKCFQHICTESKIHGNKDENLEYDEPNVGHLMFKETNIKLMVDDPYGFQRGNSRMFKSDVSNVIGKYLLIFWDIKNKSISLLLF